jgi:hypothetical protein
VSVIVLDTLEYATKLKAGGFTDQQAETQARALAEVVEKQLATQQQVSEHESNLRRDIEGLRVELKRDIETLRLEVKRDIDVLRGCLARGTQERHRRIQSGIDPLGGRRRSPANHSHHRHSGAAGESHLSRRAAAIRF